jgi:hypothetical protein
MIGYNLALAFGKIAALLLIAASSYYLLRTMLLH